MNAVACCSSWTEKQIDIINKKTASLWLEAKKLHGLTAGLTALDLFHLSHICFCLVSVASGIRSAVNISRLSAIYWRHVVWFRRYFLRIFRVTWCCKMQQPTFLFHTWIKFSAHMKYIWMLNLIISQQKLILNMYLIESLSFIFCMVKIVMAQSLFLSPSFTRWCWHSICLLVVQIFCYLLNFEAARFLFRGVIFFLNFNDEISLSSALSLWLFVPLTVCVNCKLWRRRIRSICPLHCGSSTLLGPHGKRSKFSVLCQKQACTYT